MVTVRGDLVQDLARAPARLGALLQALAFEDLGEEWSEDATSCFALLEAARIPDLPELLEASELEFSSLFRGQAQDELARVAPYLVRLDRDAALTRQLLSPAPDPEAPHWQRWGRGAVVLIRAAATLEDLLRHLRKFTRIYDEQSGRWNYFRFYAPETLRGLIAHMRPEAFAQFAAPLHFLLTEGRQAEPVLLGLDPQRLARLLERRVAEC